MPQCPNCYVKTDASEFIGDVCCICYNYMVYHPEAQAHTGWRQRATPPVATRATPISAAGVAVEEPTPTTRKPRRRGRLDDDERAELDALIEKPCRSASDNARLAELGRRIDL